MGGDEFVVLIEDDRHDAAIVAQTISQSFQAADRSQPASVSIGIMSATSKAQSLIDLLAKADGNLYEVKARRPLLG